MIAFVKNILPKTALPELDGVRAFACLSVLSYHVYYFFSKGHHHLPIISDSMMTSILNSGWSGVSLFFVLSGFLLFLPYAKAMIGQTEMPAARTFYLRRALRILPAYYVSLVILILVFHPEFLQMDHLPSLGLFATFLMDAPLTYQQINGPFWTLAIEWQYYMLLPLLAFGMYFLVRGGKTPQQRLKRLLFCLIGMICWGVGTRYLGRYFELHPDETLLVSRPVLDGVLTVIYGSVGKYYENFAVGMLVSTLFVYGRRQDVGAMVERLLTRSALWLVGIGLLVLIFMSSWDGPPFNLIVLMPYIGAHNWLIEIGYSLGYGLCVLGILFGPSWLKGACAWNPLRWIGAISFSLYIWHVPLLMWFRDWVINQLEISNLQIYLLYWAWALVLIIPFAFLSYRLIEHPWMQIAQRQRSREKHSAQQALEEAKPQLQAGKRAG